jgi:putative tricarboxylic transport membrane protein
MAMKFLYKHPDRVSGAVLMVVASVAIFEASQLPFGTIRAPDAGFFPLSLSSMLFFFAFGIFLNSFIRASEPAEFDSRSWYVVIAAAAFIVYALVLGKVGFVLATIAIMLLVMRVLGGMSWWRAIAIAVPSVLLSYVGFVQLGVPLPQGPLPF